MKVKKTAINFFDQGLKTRLLLTVIEEGNWISQIFLQVNYQCR